MSDLNLLPTDEPKKVKKVVKKEKREMRWSELSKIYDVKVISKNGGVIFFLLGDKRYYFGVPSSQMRRKGENKWTKNVISLFKKDFGKNIPLKGDTADGIPVEIVKFGKYIGYNWEEVVKIDPQYIKWVLLNIQDEGVKDFLKKYEDILKDVEQKRVYHEYQVKGIALKFFYHWQDAEWINTEKAFDIRFEKFKNEEKEKLNKG